MKNYIIKILILIFVIILPGCTIYEGTQQSQNNQNEISKDFTSKIVIKGYYEDPASIQDIDTIILDGLLEGEFIEIAIIGEIVNFEHVRLIWNENKKILEEIEVLNRFDKLINQTLVISTYIPEGIPSEKIKWQSVSGEKYEFIIAEDGENGILSEIILK